MKKHLNFIPNILKMSAVGANEHLLKVVKNCGNINVFAGKEHLKLVLLEKHSQYLLKNNY